MSDQQTQGAGKQARDALTLAALLIEAMAEAADIDLEETKLTLTVCSKETGAERPVKEISGDEIMDRISTAIAALDAEGGAA